MFFRRLGKMAYWVRRALACTAELINHQINISILFSIVLYNNRTFLSFWAMITIHPAIERLLYRLFTLSTAIWRLGVLPSFKVTPIGVRVCRVPYFRYFHVFTSNNISSDPDGPTALLMASDHRKMPYPIREPFHHRFIRYIWPSSTKKHRSVAIANTDSHAVIIYEFPRLYASNSDVKGGESIKRDT